eukprot:TRINITY_DN3049_c0_g1_i1.p1 TRINITY_DN3049_c0_g1~~TRINITY_DN3049_c0_g1_i1.p1  ORF type:complete len:562 (-),score=99.96 TRINITY_DN3049_c0_g1_i1:220-1836(-)
MDEKLPETIAKRVYAFSKRASLNKSELQEFTDAVRDLRIASLQSAEFFCGMEDYVTVFTDILQSSHLTDEILAETAWTFHNLLQSSTDRCADALFSSKTVRVLANRIMDGSLRIHSSCQMHCLGCCISLMYYAVDARESIFATGLVSYLARAYRAGNLLNDIQLPELIEEEEIGAPSSVLLVYGMFLDASCHLAIPFDLEFLESTVHVVVDILKTGPRDLAVRCLDIIARCSIKHFSGIDLDVSSHLAKIVREEVRSKHQYDEVLSKCSTALEVFVGQGNPEIDEYFGFLCLELVDQFCKEISRDVLFLLSKCPVFSLRDTLLKKTYLIFQKLIRSCELHSQKLARLCRVGLFAAYDMFGYEHEAQKISPLSAAAAFQYYQNNMIQFISAEHQVPEVIRLICDFASESYRIHQQIDALDIKVSCWCAAEILEIVLPNRVLVHYLGWQQRYDEWIQLPSPRIAPAFTFTKLEIPRAKSDALVERRNRHAISLDRLVSCKHLNLHSEDEAEELKQKLSNDVQSAINCARWMNRANLQDML